jgi:ABC-type phosphate transport system permease subunit
MTKTEKEPVQKNSPNMIGISGSILLMLSVLFPWVQAVDSQLTQTGLDKALGIPLIVIGALAILFFVLKTKWAIVLGAAGLLIFLYETLSVFFKGKHYKFMNKGIEELHHAELSYGLWILLIGSVLVIIVSIWPFLKKKKVE